MGALDEFPIRGNSGCTRCHTFICFNVKVEKLKVFQLSLASGELKMLRPQIDPGGSKEGAEEKRVTYQDNRKKAKKGMDTVNCSQRHWGMA